MSINSEKIVVCFKVKNAKYQELRKLAQMHGETHTKILQRGLDRELRSLRRKNSVAS